MALAAENGDEDGSDAKEFHARRWIHAKQISRKGAQLCAQVKDALSLVLAACADVELQALEIVSVEPAPHTGRLRVLVASQSRVGAEAACRRAASFLRAEVAAAVNRRYTPELVFEIV